MKQIHHELVILVILIFVLGLGISLSEQIDENISGEAKKYKKAKKKILKKKLAKKKYYKPSLKKKKRKYITTGCYVKVKNREIILDISTRDCESLFIAADQNYDRNDVYRLLSTFRKIKGIMPRKQDFLNKNNKITIYYRSGLSLRTYDFSEIKEKFSSNQCQTIDFFNIQLNCFNEIVGSKENNLPYMVRYLTFMKYANNRRTWNPLLNTHVQSFTFMVNTAPEFYDVSNPEVIPQHLLGNTRCDYENPTQGPAASHKENGPTFICPKILKKFSQQRMIHNAGIIYHEVNHEFNRLSHNFLQPPHRIGHIHCGDDKDKDKDFTSIYGAHIEYLLSLARNNRLTCEEQQFAYDDAVEQKNDHLCHDRRTPRISQERPVCT